MFGLRWDTGVLDFLIVLSFDRNGRSLRTAMGEEDVSYGYG